MKKATITEAKNQLSSLIDRVRHGETIVITDRGRPVARLMSALTEAADDPMAASQDWKRRGGLRLAGSSPPHMKKLTGKKKSGVLDALLDERTHRAMRFWDSSAVIPLLVAETASRDIQDLFEADPVMIVWWATDIECVSAIARQQRLGRLAEQTAVNGTSGLTRFVTPGTKWSPRMAFVSLQSVSPPMHDLRTADALQLAAALFASEDRPSTLEFLSLDERLQTAARREGFVITKVG
jgi:prevent-host-death family protein